MSQRLMRECPKYYTCSAPLCPLDEQWTIRGSNDSEGICFYLNEHGKQGAAARFLGRGASDIYEACTQMLASPLLPAWMRRKTAAAALTGSRWDSGDKLQAAWQAKQDEAA